MSRCACPPHGRWYCDACVATGARVGLDLPREPGLVRRVALTVEVDATEEELRGPLVAFAETLGYLHYHARKSKQSTAGYPDDFFVHPAGSPLFAWELKRQGEHPSPAQRRWLEALGKASRIACGVYRPEDFPELQRLLRDARGHPSKSP